MNKTKLTPDHWIVINRIKMLLHLNSVFKNEATIKIMDELEEKGAFGNILDLKACQTDIKPTCVYLGTIKRTNDTFDKMIKENLDLSNYI